MLVSVTLTRKEFEVFWNLTTQTGTGRQGLQRDLNRFATETVLDSVVETEKDVFGLNEFLRDDGITLVICSALLGTLSFLAVTQV